MYRGIHASSVNLSALVQLDDCYTCKTGKGILLPCEYKNREQ